MQKAFLLGLLVIFSFAFLLGCVEPNLPIENGNNELMIRIQNLEFTPSELRVSRGTTVIWINEDNFPHDVFSQGNFDSGILNRDESFSFTFNEVGTFNYVCLIHAGMTGRIIVE